MANASALNNALFLCILGIFILYLPFKHYSTTLDERAWESAAAIEERRENSKVFGPVPLLGVRVIDLRRTTD